MHPERLDLCDQLGLVLGSTDSCIHRDELHPQRLDLWDPLKAEVRKSLSTLKDYKHVFHQLLPSDHAIQP